MERVVMNYGPSNNWERDWPKAEKHIEEALAQGGNEATLLDVRMMLRKGLVKLWAGEHSAAVVEVDKPLLQVWAAGGQLPEMLRMMRALEEWGKARNFNRVMIYGRKGWEPVLQSEGFQHKWTVLEKII